MGVFRQFPYSNFHEMNMDEMIKIIKNMLEEWAQYHAEWDAWMNQMNDDWSNYQEVMNEAWQNMQNFINNYFDNLDVQQEINNKIISMVESGEFSSIVAPYIPPRVTEWLTEHITEPVGVVIDTSLSVAGACADAKATGDTIEKIGKNVIYTKNHTWVNDGIIVSTGVIVTNTSRAILSNELLDPNEISDIYIKSVEHPYSGALFAYLNGTYVGRYCTNNTISKSESDTTLYFTDSFDMDVLPREYKYNLMLRREEDWGITPTGVNTVVDIMYRVNATIDYVDSTAENILAPDVLNELKSNDWLRGTVGPDGTKAIGEYSGIVATFTLTTGNRYRIYADTSNAIKVNIGMGGHRYRHRNNILEFVALNNTVNIALLGVTDPTLANTKIRIYEVERKLNGIWDFIVAASDSSDDEKAIAHLVCDGTNDEIELNCAVNSQIYNSDTCNVLLMPGHYNIDSFSEYGTVLADVYSSITPYTDGLGAIITDMSVFGDNNRNNVYICGKHSDVAGKSGVFVTVSDSVIANLDGDIEHSVFTAVRLGTTNFGYVGAKIFNRYENIRVYLGNYNKKIIAYDGIGNYGFCAERCQARTALSDNGNVNFNLVTISEGLIGFRGDTGADYGIYEWLKSCYATGFDEGFAITGEHFIVDSCSSIRNRIGITIDYYDAFLNAGHTNTFINCTVERCDRFMIIGYNGDRTEDGYGNVLDGVKLIYIGGTTENEWEVNSVTCTMKPILEILKGCTAGRIETEWWIDGNANKTFWDTTSATGISCVNMELTNLSLIKYYSGHVNDVDLPNADMYPIGSKLWVSEDNAILVSNGSAWINLMA